MIETGLSNASNLSIFPRNNGFSISNDIELLPHRSESVEFRSSILVHNTLEILQSTLSIPARRVNHVSFHPTRDQIRDTFIENLLVPPREMFSWPTFEYKVVAAATTSCGKLSHASASDDPRATRAKTFQSSFFATSPLIPCLFPSLSLFFFSPSRNQPSPHDSQP